MDIYTERLKLRKITIEDVKDIFEYSKEDNIGPNAGWKPHENMQETLEISRQIFIEKENVWGICLKDDNKIIGTIGLIDDPKRENNKAKMIGYAILEKHWGKGFMTEATKKVIDYGFRELKLDLISAYCYPFNIRSKKVLEKCGFEYEGILKKAEKIYDGNVYDNICFAILKEKYI